MSCPLSLSRKLPLLDLNSSRIACLSPCVKKAFHIPSNTSWYSVPLKPRLKNLATPSSNKPHALDPSCSVMMLSRISKGIVLAFFACQALNASISLSEILSPGSPVLTLLVSSSWTPDLSPDSPFFSLGSVTFFSTGSSAGLTCSLRALRLIISSYSPIVFAPDSLYERRLCWNSCSITNFSHASYVKNASVGRAVAKDPSFCLRGLVQAFSSNFFLRSSLFTNILFSARLYWAAPGSPVEVLIEEPSITWIPL